MHNDSLCRVCCSDCPLYLRARVIIPQREVYYWVQNTRFWCGKTARMTTRPLGHECSLRHVQHAVYSRVVYSRV